MKSDDLTKRLDTLRPLTERNLEPAEVGQFGRQLDRSSELVSSSPAAGQNLRELNGLGKEIWRPRDTAEFLREEPLSWR